jgi:hypothetical protein
LSPLDVDVAVDPGHLRIFEPGIRLLSSADHKGFLEGEDAPFIGACDDFQLREHSLPFFTLVAALDGVPQVPAKRREPEIRQV